MSQNQRIFVQKCRSLDIHNFFLNNPILDWLGVLRSSVSLLFTYGTFCAITADVSWLWDSNGPLTVRRLLSHLLLSVGYYPTVDCYRTESSKVKSRGRDIFSATKIIKIDEIVKTIHNFEVRGFAMDFQGSSSVKSHKLKLRKMN